MTIPSQTQSSHSLTDTFTQGGQTQLHKFHMIQQVFGTTLKVSLWICLITFLILLFIDHGIADLWFLTCYFKAYIRTHYLTFLPQDLFNSCFILNRDGSAHTVQDFWLMQQDRLHIMAFTILLSFFKKFLQSLIFSILSLLSISSFWVYMGSKRQKTKILSGFEIVTPKTLNALTQKKGVSPYTIGSISIPKDSEFQHTFVTGTTGSGKSNMIHHLLHQIRQNKDQAIIVDTTGGLRSRFFNSSTDLLLNPFDPLSQNWNMWSEIQSPTMIDEIAESLIPNNHSSQDDFWIQASRTVLCESIRYLISTNQQTYQNLIDMTLNMPLKDLHSKLVGTPAASIMDPSIDKTALGVRASLSNHLKSLSSLKDSDEDLSLTQFASQTPHHSKSWLFLSCSTDEREYLKPLFSTWISLLIKGIMKRKEHNGQRTWIIIDELASLHKLPSLMVGLSEIRKYGGCFVLGFQDLSQIDALYGTHATKTLSNLTGTKVLFRCTDTDIANRVSRYAGESDRLESTESISFGAHQMRDGVNLSTSRHIKPVISGTDVMMLKDLECFVKFGGDFPVAKVMFEYMK